MNKSLVFAAIIAAVALAACGKKEEVVVVPAPVVVTPAPVEAAPAAAPAADASAPASSSAPVPAEAMSPASAAK